MNELVKIGKTVMGQEEVETVNARELHGKLGIGKDFSTWVKIRLEETQAIKNSDFVILEQYSPETGETQYNAISVGGRPRKEYFLTLDTAKHICMLERTEIGRKIRQYFIDVEKAAKKALSSGDPIRNLINATTMILDKLDAMKAKQIELQVNNQRLAQNIEEIECKADAILSQSDYYSILGYSRLLGLPITLQYASTLGKRAAKISSEKCIPVGNVPDPRFGKVGTYHISVLRDLFEKTEI